MSWLQDIEDSVIRRVPELGTDENEFLLEDLIDDAFKTIMTYSGANSYNTDWDRTLVRCVAILYNKIGNEGSTSRTSLSTTDYYDSAVELASVMVADIPQYIKPVGYKYPENRMKYPE